MKWERVNQERLIETETGERNVLGDVEEESGCSEDEIDVVDNDGDLDEIRDGLGDEEGSIYAVFNTEQIWEPTFELGMRFSNKKEFKKAIHSHAIKTKRTIKFSKNDKIRMYAKCGNEECEWKMHAIKLQDEETFQINLFNPHHSCPQIFDVKNVKTEWLRDKYIQKFKSDPKRNMKGFRVDIVNELRVNVSNDQAYRAKRAALKAIEGSPDYQYTRLWDYAEEIRVTVCLWENRFSRLYVCFGALKVGFKSGCRPIIGVDGCHLKGPHGGILLTACGVDPNNNLFSIAYAVVNKECRETWEWFFIILKHDLNIVRQDEFTFMSDKQKGLIQALDEVFPGSGHRFCVRHLHNNFKLTGFRGLAYKNALWAAAKACTVGEWKMKMTELKAMSQAAFDWFNDKPATQWSRSHFSEIATCDMLLNNVCETFNACILEAREKPILTMLEWIREYLMRRLQENRDRATSKWRGKICPKIQEILQKQISKVSDCIPIKADDTHYQVSCFDGSQHSVDLGAKSCSCRKFQLCGIPCKHACCAIFYQKQDPVEYVDKCYYVETYKRVYRSAILPMSHEGLWAASFIIPPLPPNFERGAGRPARARRREADEPVKKNKKMGQLQKIRRNQKTIHCRTSGEPGHNSAKCPERDNVQDQNEDGNHLVQPSKTRQPARRVSKRKISEANQGEAGTNSRVTTESFHGLENHNILPPLHEDFNEDDGLCDAVITQETTMHTQEEPLYKSGPSMYQQMIISNQQTTLQPRVNIRAPPPMIGTQLFQRFNPPRIFSQTVKPIIKERGYKYLDLSKNAEN